MNPGRRQRSPAARVLGAAIGVYRYAISPMLPPRCRYWPSCSEYALEAIGRHGAARGGWLSLGRVLRCHPWADGGVDPVPLTLPTNPRWNAYRIRDDDQPHATDSSPR